MHKSLIALLAAAAVTGCASDASRDTIGLTVQESAFRPVGTAVMVLRPDPERDGNSCFVGAQADTGFSPQAGVAAILLGAAIPVVADLIVNVASAALTREVEGRNGVFVASSSTGVEAGSNPTNELGHPFEHRNCIVVYRGAFSNERRPDFSDAGLPLDADALATLRLYDYPSFYLELAVRAVGESVTLEPVFLSYAGTSATRLGSGEKYVSMILAASENTPETGSEDEVEEGAVAVFRFDFGSLTVGQSYRQGTLWGTSSIATFEDAIPSQPLSLTALVTESEEPSLALSAFVEAFSSNEADLRKALRDLFAEVLADSDQGE